MAKTQKAKETQSQKSAKGSDRFSSGEAVPAIIEEIIGRTGFRGEITQVKCMVQEEKIKDVQWDEMLRDP